MPTIITRPMRVSALALPLFVALAVASASPTTAFAAGETSPPSNPSMVKPAPAEPVAPQVFEGDVRDLLRRVARRDQPLSPTALKYRLREHFNDQISFCGPHVGVMHVDRSKRYRQFTYIMTNLEEFHAILEHNNLPYTGPWSDQDKQLVIREHNILSAIRLDGVGEKFDFHLRVPESKTSGLTIEEPIEPVGPHILTNAFIIEGSIDQNGVINISKTEPIYHVCPQ